MKLTVLEVTTLLGATYRFPDAMQSDIDTIVQHAGRGDSCSSLSVHNVSGAVMVMPWRIVSAIICDGEVRWKNPKRSV